MRIVSLVPAATDIVRALGLANELVGVSHECDLDDGIPRPKLTRSLVDTTGLSSADIDAAVTLRARSGSPLYEIDARQLADLRPDLILTQGLCDVCALPARTVASALPIATQPLILSLDGRSIEAMLASIVDIGSHTGRTREAVAQVEQLRRRLGCVDAAVHGRRTVPTVCLEWLDPPFASGHWIPEMVARAGGRDVLGRLGIPSVAIEWPAVAAAHAEVIIAIPCGYDLDRAARDVACLAGRPEWQQATAGARVLVGAGGRYFTRPGPDLVTGVEVLAAMLHPDAADWTIPSDVMRPWS